MALFRRKAEAESVESTPAQSRLPLVSRRVYCTVCESDRDFSPCWRRVGYPTTCSACGLRFNDLAKLYNQVLPACPQCEEPLEQPGFDYGTCTTCGSKYEIMEGTKPTLLPNRAQRDTMDTHGRARRIR